MTRRELGRNIALSLGMLACALLAARHDAAAEARARNTKHLYVPPVTARYPLPPIPDQSPRNANYTINARLVPETHAIEGSLVLDWTNRSDVAVQTFPFHLYWNAVHDSRSAPEGESGRAADPGEGRAGFIHVTQIHLVADVDVDLTPTLRYIHPDNGNADDRTVMEVRTPAVVDPGQRAQFRIDWTSRLPYGDSGRAGWVHDYNFVAQWFPKIGVVVDGHWNAHQVHPWSEPFADYGVYDVTLTLPRGHIVGATGRLLTRTSN